MKEGIIIRCKSSSFQMLTCLNDTKGKDYALFQSTKDKFGSPALWQISTQLTLKYKKGEVCLKAYVGETLNTTDP